MSKTVRSPNSKPSVRRTDVGFLKLRVEELENEVGELKKRLTDLRRAKNTTVLKKEKEYVSTGTPEHKRSNSGSKRLEELHMQMKELNLKHEKEIETLTKKHSEDLQTSLAKNNPGCDHDKIIAELKENYRKLEVDNKDLKLVNDELQSENMALRDKFEQLFTELSIKEAQWCEREEQLNLKLKMQWGEKYREWMEATEKKIEELQKANALLRSCIKPPADD
ncbi:uncharacterized protein [Amphiura filiformis]|uniref:uncharacterized protein n=1 Tax=Amphiura filiformis TaxID=82378 RepID=UPI003B21EEA5